MTALPESEISVPDDAPAFYLWLLVPLNVGGVVASLSQASVTAHREMDEHGGAQALAVFEAQPAPDWPYVRLVPTAGSTRAIHERTKANIARAQRRKAERNAHRRAARRLRDSKPD